MTITPDTRLDDLVVADPALAGLLERHGLDYCCHGDRTLAAACRADGVDPDVVLAELAAAAGTGPAPAWAGLGPGELVDHIEATHHRYLWEELPLLTALAARVQAVHGTNHPELAAVARVVEELRADLEPHLTKEERVLFPMVRALAAATPAPPAALLRAAIARMRDEHDHAGDLLDQLRQLTDGYAVPPDGCASFRSLYGRLAELEQDTHRHVHKENNVLFPAVLALATPGPL